MHAFYRQILRNGNHIPGDSLLGVEMFVRFRPHDGGRRRIYEGEEVKPNSLVIAFGAAPGRNRERACAQPSIRGRRVRRRRHEIRVRRTPPFTLSDLLVPPHQTDISAAWAAVCSSSVRVGVVLVSSSFTAPPQLSTVRCFRKQTADSARQFTELMLGLWSFFPSWAAVAVCRPLDGGDAQHCAAASGAQRMGT